MATPGKRSTADGPGPGRVVITGASAGIGAELAREFARHGHRLTLVARRRPLLDELADALRGEFDADVAVVVQDLAEPDGPAAAVAAAQADGAEIGILVNNAGVIDVGRFVDADGAKLAGLVDLNIRALTAMTHLVLPGMVERGSGRVLNVASLAAFQAIPSMATYAASKAYVLSLTEALNEELRGTGVSITAVCPGVTDTGMAKDIETGAVGTQIPKQLLSAPRDVARQAYKALMAGQTVLVPGIANQVTAAWAQVTPRWLTAYMAGFATRWPERVRRR